MNDASRPGRLGRVRSMILGRSSADVGWVLSSNLIGLVGNVLSVAIVVSRIGVSSFGEYVVAYSAAGLLSGFVIQGQLLAYLDYAVRVGEPPTEVARSTVGSFLTLGSAFAAVATLVVTGVLDVAGLMIVLPIAVSELVLNPISTLCTNVLQSERGFRSATKLRWTLQVLRILATVAFWVSGAETIRPLVLCIIGFSALSAAISLTVLGQLGYVLTPRWPRKRYLRTSATLASGIMSATVFDESDKLVLARHSKTELGQYAFAYRLLGVSLVPLGAMLSVAYNRILSLSGQPAHLRRVTAKFLMAATGYGMCVGIGALLAAPVLEAILPAGYDPSANMFRVLAWVVLARGFSGYMSTFLIASGRQAQQALINVLVAGFGVLLYLVLIPRYGWAGAAASTLIGETLGAVIMSTFAVRIMREPDVPAPLEEAEVVQRA
jgi:O-antigen/teichoic acid export membrane protein